MSDHTRKCVCMNVCVSGCGPAYTYVCVYMYVSTCGCRCACVWMRICSCWCAYVMRVYACPWLGVDVHVGVRVCKRVGNCVCECVWGEGGKSTTLCGSPGQRLQWRNIDKQGLKAWSVYRSFFIATNRTLKPRFHGHESVCSYQSHSANAQVQHSTWMLECSFTWKSNKSDVLQTWKKSQLRFLQFLRWCGQAMVCHS